MVDADGQRRFRVGLTADFYDEVGKPKYPDLGLSVFADEPTILTTPLSEHRPVIGSDQLGDLNALIVLTPAVTAETVSRAEQLLAICRFGVGYDSVDVKACTAAHVLATITPGAVDRPVAEAVVGWMIALSHHVLAKDRLVRTGGWNTRSQYMGRELRERTLGLVGLGGIARKTIELLKPFGMGQILAFDPFVSADVAAELGVRKVELEELLRSSDFVSIHCPLTEETRSLLGARELSWMKSDAYLINTARGGIVDEDALYGMLRDRKIAGAALDCFDNEPLTEPHRFGEFENVLLAPHCIAWTEELFRDIGRSACQVSVDLLHGRRPKGVLNPELFEQREFVWKWAAAKRRDQ